MLEGAPHSSRYVRTALWAVMCAALLAVAACKSTAGLGTPGETAATAQPAPPETPQETPQETGDATASLAEEASPEPPAVEAAPPPGFSRHAVAAAHPLAAEAGLEMLRAGGSAVDAAIAAQMVLNLVEPQSSGIGGGGFMMHYSAESGEIAAYDGRETAPAGSNPYMFMDGSGKPRQFQDAAVGGLAVGVPGLLRMLELAHREHGRLPWIDLFEPAIRLATEGFEVSPRLHAMVDADRYLKTFPATAAYFHDDQGKARPVGHRLVNRPLAETLRLVAKYGADAFYNGPLGVDMVRAVRGADPNPGFLSEEDLEGYRAKKRQPVCLFYRLWMVCGMPPPSSGGVTTLQILGILQRFELAALEPASAPAIHLVSEASRLAFADRDIYVADPDFIPVPTAGMLDPGYLDLRGQGIGLTRSLGLAEPGMPGVGGGLGFAPGDDGHGVSTTQLSVIDEYGNAVAMTTSIESAFGSRLMVRGFLLNSQLTDFAFDPNRYGAPVANRLEPGKRPLSSMAPTLVFDGSGKVAMAVGSPGGSRTIGYVAKTLIGVLDWGLDIKEAIDLPNFLNRNGVTELERGTALEDLAPALQALGHEVSII